MHGSERRRNEEPDGLDTAAATRPLRILVTGAAREELALRTLAREALPMLRRPDAFTSRQRHRLAQALAEVLDDPGEDDPAEARDGEGGEWP